jgi:hypothetical protein
MISDALRQQMREAAAKALHDADDSEHCWDCGCGHLDHHGDVCADLECPAFYVATADAVLAAIEPIIEAELAKASADANIVRAVITNRYDFEATVTKAVGEALFDVVPWRMADSAWNKARAERAHADRLAELLHRLRQWDCLTPGFLADNAYWCEHIDQALADHDARRTK